MAIHEAKKMMVIRLITGLSLAAVLIAAGTRVLDRALDAWRWRYALITPVMGIFGAILAVMVTAWSGSEDWTLVLALVVLESIALVLVSLGAYRAGSVR